MVFLIIALPMPPHVKQCFEGDNGILAGLSKDKVWIDHSTTDYEQTLAFNDLAQNKGAQCLEAPITGGLEALSKGQMTVFMAGQQQLAEEVSIAIQYYSPPHSVWKSLKKVAS